MLTGKGGQNVRIYKSYRRRFRRLHTPYKNFRNHHFYEKMGYKKIGETQPKEDKNGFYLFEYEKRILSS